MSGIYTFLVLLLLGAVHCQVYVDVNANCDGENVCSGSASSPFSSILQGLNAIPNGGSIIVRDGTYTGVGNKNLNVSSSDTSIRSVNGASNTIIDCENDGFAFDLFAGTFSIQGFTVRNCYRNIEASYQDRSYGGGAFSIHSTFTTLTDMYLENNDAKGFGGAVYIFSNTVFMYNTTITNNDVSGIGGGVYVESAYLKLDNATVFKNNEASVNASDLFCISGTVELFDQASQVGNVVCPSCSVVRDHKSLCKNSGSVLGASWAIICCLIVLLVNVYI